ncbi:hypothetical protein E2C01_092243 [Portunus trituberculatus]|uniref:Uncharacterized protein n=1 Tax=Portunus trituberculatus TaxID=210409 RepID=A0A5B7JJL2_PORTR|nr:hypothetical protein [Portunus trituberculatus]
MLNYWFGRTNPASSVQRERLSHPPSPQPRAASIPAHSKQAQMGLSRGCHHPKQAPDAPRQPAKKEIFSKLPNKAATPGNFR